MVGVRSTDLTCSATTEPPRSPFGSLMIHGTRVTAS